MTPSEPTAGVPDYAERVLAFHRAHRESLRTIVGALPVRSGDRVLDLACGDGTYLELLAERGARAHGLDRNGAYLELCAERIRDVPLVAGDAVRLPFARGAFDGALCAQSFYSLPDVPGAIAALAGVVRPGGWIAAMENDRLHHVVLPWPPGLEIKLRFAELQGVLARTPEGSRHYGGRRLGALLQEAGLEDVEVVPFGSHRRAPLHDDERTFLAGYIDELVDLARDALASDDREHVDRLTDPRHSDYLLDDPDLEVTYLDLLAWARVPGGAGDD